MTAVLALGAVAGIGVATVLVGVRGRARRLDVALGALDRPRRGTDGGRIALGALTTATGRWVTDTDLAVLDRTQERHLTRKLAAATIMAALPVAAGAVAAMAGLSPRALVILLASSALAAVGFVAPDLEVRSAAAERRDEFVHALSGFLDVTAVLLAGGAGTESALHAAAALGEGWPHRQLRAALDRCQLTGETPWQAFAGLGDRLDVDELTQLATSLQLAGEQGARVRTTLTERARALRATQLAQVEARARAVTEQMSVPVALLAVAFMLFVGFPAVWVVVGQL